MSLRLIFMGTPDFAVPTLLELVAQGHDIVAVYTRAPKPAGRGMKEQVTPVEREARRLGLAVLTPKTLKTEDAQAAFSAFGADAAVVLAYGLILPQAILEAVPLGCFNLHASLLPRWRGAAPIQRSLWAGDSETGVTIMQMDVGLDTGDMLYKLCCPITAQDTSATLYDKLAQLGPQGLLETLSQLADGRAQPEKQDDAQANYAEKLSKEEARLDWQLSAAQLERCIRAFNPWPVSYFLIEDQPVKVWQATVLPHVAKQPGEIVAADKHGIQVATAEGVLNLQLLQPAGKKAMSAQDLLNSRREWFTPGRILA